MKRRYDSKTSTVEDLIRENTRKGPGGCLLWTRGVNSWGYPQVNRGGKLFLLTRWVLTRKLRRPLKLKALHKCSVPRCLAERHLYEGTLKQNSQDRNKLARGYKLNLAIARKIRRSKDKGRVWAQRLAVSDALISMIRSNQIWREQ